MTKRSNLKIQCNCIIFPGLLWIKRTSRAGALLPCDLKPHEPCNTDRRRFFNNSLRGCFLAGDTRVSENTALAGMHTIFVRLHNHYAKQLRERNPRWSSNLIFQTTRRIVVTVVQHITFKEWLPIIIRVPK